MKKMLNNFKSFLGKSILGESESRVGFRNYKITLYIKIDKKANVDVNQAFNKIRSIVGVTTLKQEKAIQDRITYWLCEVTIKFNTQGVPTRNYIYDTLTRQINSELEMKGVPGAKVYGINWRSFAEI